MKYRKFGKTDWEISVLGLGVMQLQNICEAVNRDSESEWIEIIRYAIDKGVNYIDLGFPFYVQSDSVNRALQNGYREKVKVAVNLPSHLINSYHDFDKYLNDQIRRFNLEKIDFCMIEGLDRKTWPKLRKIDVQGWADNALKIGQISNVGFTFHDDVLYLRDIVESYDQWSHCQIQFSFMDVNHHPGIGGLKFAAEKGLPVIVTNPLKGRRLVNNLPEAIAEVWGNALEKRTLTEWGMRFAWNHSEVTSVIGDINNKSQLITNLDLADNNCSEQGNLTVLEQLTFNLVKDSYRSLRSIACTSCRVCMPCTIEIDVPRIFELYNDAIMYNDSRLSSFVYLVEEHNLEKCVKCGRCQKKCPKRLPLLNTLDSARKLLEQV